MDNTQAEIIAIMDDYERGVDVKEPLQKLFDECLNFISVNDFMSEKLS